MLSQKSQKIQFNTFSKRSSIGASYLSAADRYLKDDYFGKNINKEAVKEYLKSFDWPEGLQNVCLQSMENFPIRYFILDDSGSMVSFIFEYCICLLDDCELVMFNRLRMMDIYL